jgi:predicted RNA-binding protein with PUA-like domain
MCSNDPIGGHKTQYFVSTYFIKDSYFPPATPERSDGGQTVGMTNMNYWLMKSEPESYSIDDLKRDRKTIWTSIRNYRARNIMRDEMKPGDLFLFYHSMAEPTGIVGIGKVVKNNLPDKTALDKKDEYYDPKATAVKNPWVAPEVQFVQKFKRIVTLSEIKKDKRFKDMILLKIPRLSVQPVSKSHFDLIVKMGQ